MISNRRWIVALPAKDEAERLGGALAAIDAAAEMASWPVQVLVLANNCRDATRAMAAAQAARARQAEIVVRAVELPVSLAHAGGARAACVAAALAVFGVRAGRTSGDTLLTTDADARFVPDALARMEAAFLRGADLVLCKIECVRDMIDPVAEAALAFGTPQVVWRHKVRQLIETIRTGSVPFPALHDDYGGAGIAVTAAAHHLLGGFPAVPSDEDKAFVQAADARGLTVDRQSGAQVEVLARARGRAAGGMACALARNALAAERGDVCLVERHERTAARLYARPCHAHAFAENATDCEPVADAIAGLDRLIAGHARLTA